MVLVSLQIRKAKENLGRMTRKVGGAGTEKWVWLKRYTMSYMSHITQMNVTCTIQHDFPYVHVQRVNELL